MDDDFLIYLCFSTSIVCLGHAIFTWGKISGLMEAKKLLKRDKNRKE